MTKFLQVLTASLAMLALLTVGTYSRRAQAQPPQQYPIMDKVAAKIIAKYQNSTCQELWVQKSEKTPPTPEEQRAIQFLHSDPQMRAYLIGKVASPIANKMFECGLIP